MHRITKVIDFCYGHRLLHSEGPCRFLHGHNGRVEIDLAVEQLDHRGMVADFRRVRAIVKEWIDREFDHRMLLHRDDPATPLLRQLGEPIYLMDVNPTAEHIAQIIFAYARGQGLPVVEVRLWETPSSFAAYAEGR